jgi:hypothetical protein
LDAIGPAAISPAKEGGFKGPFAYEIVILVRRGHEASLRNTLHARGIIAAAWRKA